MRSTYTGNFCSACIEGLWISLLSSVSLVDNVTQIAAADGSTNVTLELLPLAQFRQGPYPRAEGYEITWYGADEGVVLAEYANSTSALIAADTEEFGVEVRFWTEQVRVDEDDVLVFKERYAVV